MRPIINNNWRTNGQTDKWTKRETDTNDKFGYNEPRQQTANQYGLLWQWRVIKIIILSSSPRIVDCGDNNNGYTPYIWQASGSLPHPGPKIIYRGNLSLSNLTANIFWTRVSEKKLIKMVNGHITKSLSLDQLFLGGTISWDLRYLFWQYVSTHFS